MIFPFFKRGGEGDSPAAGPSAVEFAFPPADGFRNSYINPACIPPVTGIWDEIDSDSYVPTAVAFRYPYVDATGTNLIAQDPYVFPIEDGYYHRDADQMELYFYLLSAPSPTATEPQIVRYWVTAKVAD